MQRSRGVRASFRPALGPLAGSLDEGVANFSHGLGDGQDDLFLPIPFSFVFEDAEKDVCV
jgi:hypothetical protein